MASPITHMDPLNSIGRFLLELVAAYGIGAGLWEATSNWLITGLVVLAALVAWGRFRVPNDPGPAPRPVSGVVRLTIEGVVLIGGGLGLWIAHGATPALIFFGLLAIHYATTPRRLRHVLSFR